ncbi:putative non-heme dioxygenase domain, isopenicillin N synthase [Dioscorea sansibarensis]
MDAPMSRAVKSVSTERKMAEERAESREAPPTEYIVKESQRRPVAPTLLTSQLPVVHLSQPGEAEELKMALQSWGMFQENQRNQTSYRTTVIEALLFGVKYETGRRNKAKNLVINHNMTPSFLDEIRDVARAFFKLPTEEKKKYSNIRNGKFG